MKLLVVEDERLALDDLLAMLRPLAVAHTIVGCSSAAEALREAERAMPDLVITDIRMPGMDGLELVRHLKGLSPDFVAVILSGHSEFEYAREGMRLGITDYLLKPVRTEALLQTVTDALRALSEERARETQLREARMVRLLLGGQRAAEDDAKLLAGRWGLIISLCENWESPVVWRDTTIDRERMARWLGEAGLSPCHIVGIDGHIRVSLVPLQGVPHVLLERGAMGLHRALLSCGLVIHTTCAVKEAGESPATPLAEGLRRLGQAIRFAAPTFLPADLSGDVPVSVASEQLRLMERALADGKIATAVAQVHTALALLRQQQASQMAIVELLTTAFQLFQRYARPGHGETLPERAALVTLLRRLRSYDELATWVDLQLQPLLEGQRGTTTPRLLVRSLVARVHAGYAEDISLQSFAAEHGVSLAYFSRLFKDEVGMTFSEYLTHIRIEKAKELLARGDLRPGEISALVGYEDPKYFSQIFRRAAGMSPLDYQRSHQREA